MSGIFRARISKVKRELARRGLPSAMLLSSAPKRVFSRDTYFPFRQDSDFYYLTGSLGEDCALLISSEARAPILFVPELDPLKVIWDGAAPNYKDLSASIGAELVVYKDRRKEILAKLSKVEELYFTNVEGSISDKIGRVIATTPAHMRSALPKRLTMAEVILGPMRLIKTAGEIRLIKAAAKITNNALFQVMPLVRPGNTEAQIAYGVDYHIRMQAATCAFNTIAACGPSAAVLHYEKYEKSLKRGEMLLIDCGASKDYYNADITRVVPVGGKFKDVHADIYSIVLEAQKAAISKIRAGNLSGDMFTAAAKVITEGLVELRVLRGKTSKLLSKQAYKPFFMHGIGHTLGIDVHDVGTLRGNNRAKLQAGMVITVEPGLYFAKKVGHVPACGVRIEDDVLVTKRGYQLLTEGFPKEIDQIENLMGKFA